MRKIVAVGFLFLLLSHAGTAGAFASDDIGLRAGVEAAFDVTEVERTPLPGGVVHYRFDLRIGVGEHDVIRMHRVVRERAPWLPARAGRGAFLVHGDGWGFEPTFLAGAAAPELPDDRSFAVFLATRGIDVWGVDFRWVLVPSDVTELSFMADWGLDTQLGDLDLALSVARTVRTLTGSGRGRLHLVGFSRGGQLGWALAGEESQRPPALRHVRGLVSIENAFQHEDPALREADCASHEAVAASIAAGTVASDYRFVADVGDLATTAPDAPSPFLPSLSNADLAEWLGASVGGGSIPHFHSVGGLVDPATLVTELLYTEPASWFAFLSGAASFQPLRTNLDGLAIGCDEIDSPYEAHLAEIEVPVLYVGVAGAFGALGSYTTTLVASSDVSTLIVSEAADPADDWGHDDPWLAEDAEALVWQPILDWIGAR